MPPAPPKFSITICWPRISLMRAPIMRAMVSTGPPAAKGTTRLIGRAGQLCACAVVMTANEQTAAAMMIRTIEFLPRF